VADLGPDDFTELRQAMVAKGWGVVTFGNCSQRVRVLFKFAFDNGSIDRPVRYGQSFKTPSRKTVRIDRAKKGPKLFTAAEVRTLIDGAGGRGGRSRTGAAEFGTSGRDPARHQRRLRQRRLRPAPEVEHRPGYRGD
jgi:hypothetical protein